MDPSRDEQPTVADEEGAFIRFLDIAGHDLRNPIAVLKSHVQLMQRRLSREDGRDQELRDLGRMAFQIERLVVRLDTYLDAARIAQGQFSLQLNGAATDLGAIARRLGSVYRMASRAHTVVFELPDTSVNAPWDSPRVELALANLLTNALKYSAKGQVQVRIAREPQVARISVTDSGIGVPEGEEEAIFEAYTHGSNVENPGVGLGLYVAREIVRSHGGEIGVISSAGEGATFWFTLPLGGNAGFRSRAELP
ncbi:MAG TPA: HAMP domain-containing sensor histidine kinase [Ktedonobacterales bacterium]|nr:HAMP domain-containing sensor histidine kinase [Ktedonobacterales bacterium]